MFEFDDCIRRLSKLSDMNPRKAKRVLGDLMTDEEFLKWVFVPPENQPTTVDQFNELQSYLIAARNIRTLIDAIAELDYDVDRAVATLLNNLCGVAIGAVQEQSEILSKEKKSGTISNKELAKMEDKLERYQEDIEDLAKVAKKIVKRQVKVLSEDCGLDKVYCRLGYWYVPGPKYIAKNRVGRFLKPLLGAIYDEAALDGFPENRRTVRWRSFFKAIFGKDNIYSVATFILLEGVGRIDKYRSSDGLDAVRDCWDSLTDYALSELNEAPDEIRNQMVELYVKRVDRQFRNHRTDLRVDITKLGNAFSKLQKTVDQYADQLMKIFDNAQKEREKDD